jgi:hypothetical protein
VAGGAGGVSERHSTFVYQNVMPLPTTASVSAVEAMSRAKGTRHSRSGKKTREAVRETAAMLGTSPGTASSSVAGKSGTRWVGATPQMGASA